MHKPEWLSKSAEVLVEKLRARKGKPYEVVVVGSGYGGAVAAARLAARRNERGEVKVCVLERGREHLPGTFPRSFSELPGHLRFTRPDQPGPQGMREGLFDLRIGQDVSVLVASGLGGGSLINAGVVIEPDPEVFRKPPWPAAIAGSLPGYYQTAMKGLSPEAAKTTDSSGYRLEKLVQFENFSSGKANAVNITVDAQECVQCGDCATGCNVGAKKTLSTTYLAEAVQHGAKIYTGATVSHLERDGELWVIHFAFTEPLRPQRDESLHQVRARHVVLAAGTFGSTEILMRTRMRSKGALAFSPSLGQRFSTNGDMISAGYKVGARANAAGNEFDPLDQRRVGPTITGVAQAQVGGQRITIEELAIPGALRQVFEEVVTTTDLLDALGRRDRHGHAPFSDYDPALGGRHPSPPPNDPAAVNREVVESCQVFAAMGDDGAKGSLELVPGWNEREGRHRVHDGAIRVRWPKKEDGEKDIFDLQDEELARRASVGGWTYLRNPLWQPIPAGLSKALSGSKPTGLLFSVHPLGGCPMADNPGDGVVDQFGQVFDCAEGGTFHEGLLVLDGSIVPTALGVNPLLTITALAERAIDLHPVFSAWSKKSPTQPPPVPPKPPQMKPAAQPATALSFAERMTGPMRLKQRGFANPFSREKLPLAQLTLQFGRINDVTAFLRKPIHFLKVGGTLALKDTEGDGAEISSAPVDGRVHLLVRGATTFKKRTWGSLWSYGRLRAIPDLIGKLRALGKESFGDYLKSFIGYFDLASNVGEVRYLFYKFELKSELRDKAGNLLPAGTILRGHKTLTYRVGANPWRQLADLELRAKPPNTEKSFPVGTLTVDIGYLFKGFASQLQIEGQRDLPASWLALGSLALFIARLILKIHFWSFRLPEYQKYDPQRDLRRIPGPLPCLHMERHIVGYPKTPQEAGVFLPITRYCVDKDKPGEPVLLIHGLGSGGIQFATPRAPNLVQHLAQRGFDVWVAELRTSIVLPSSLDQWTLDEVARLDIPRIVNLVLEKTGREQTSVVAHCIGSAMFCTAVLDGRLQHTSGKSKIRSAALLQVGPLITLSQGTRARTLVAAPLRRFLPDGHLDFSVDDRADWMQSALDRLLTTYPYPPDEAKHHKLSWWPWCNEHIANCNRWAGIDGMMIRHENLSAEMLEHLGEILGHSSITTWTQTIQYGFLERLTDSDGRNAYVTPERVREHFRFPVRFLHGADNDVFLPLTSLRSQELLKRVHGKDFPADVVILEGYRHLDPLIGKNAEEDVFHFISGHLQEEHKWQPAAPQRRTFYFRRPLVGPVLGWTRRDKATGKWWVRVWCRLDDLRSPVSRAVLQVCVCATGELRPARVIPCPSASSPGARLETLDVGAMDTVLCVDVELDRSPGEYRIFVLSAHEGVEGQVDDQQRLAELAAGKRLSTRQPHEDRAQSLDSLARDPASFQAWLKRAREDGAEASEKVDHALVRVPAAQSEVSFAVASCRYPGWLFDRKQADATFDAIRRQDEATPLSALFLLGDQIYADATAGAFDPKDRKERFYDAYREAWSAPNAAEVLRRVPTCMALDDHEAGNDWHPEDRLEPQDRVMREEGLAAFRRYQWLHSRGNTGQPKAAPPERDVLHYDFDLRDFPVFVCDARTGRQQRRNMLGADQFTALKEWMLKHREAPKFVVSSSVVVPFSNAREEVRRARSDGWDGFEPQLRELFGFMAWKGIDNVVFLCGDSHLSNCSRIEILDGAKVALKAYCIVASPMYAPYPFANAQPEEFQQHNYRSPLPLPSGHEMRYWVVRKSYATRDCFTLVRASPRGLSVSIGGQPATRFRWHARSGNPASTAGSQPVSAQYERRPTGL